MVITFLGTGAAEGYPGLWCDCPHCSYARTHGGRNLRANSCALVDDDILLDMNAACFAGAAAYDVNLRAVRRLFVTHAHLDHFYPQHLVWRAMRPGMDALSPDAQRKESQGRFTPLPMLDIYGNAYVEKAIGQNERIRLADAETYRMAFHTASPGETITLDDLIVTPLAARHGATPDYTLHYILRRGDRTVLYATDGDAYPPQMLDILHAHRFDCAIVEGTFGLTGAPRPGHMDYEKNLSLLRHFNTHGLWKGAANMVLTHMSPHWTPPHDAYAPLMAEHGIRVAYDGLRLSI